MSRLTNKLMNRIMPIMVLGAMLVLQGCSSYSSSFSCPDARGLNCLPMRLVDQKIDNREVADLEQFNYKGRKCKVTKQLPPLQIEELNRVEIDDELTNQLNDY